MNRTTGIFIGASLLALFALLLASNAQETLEKQIHRTERLNRKLKISALDEALGGLKGQLRASRQSAPASAEGRRLIKRSKAQEYEMFR